MTYLFTCPHCHSQTLVGDEYSGLAGDCAECHQQVELPDFAGLGPVTEPARGGWIGSHKIRMAIAGVMALAATVCLLFVVSNYGGQAMQQMQASRMRINDATNLQQLAAALNAYANDYGTYPPSVTMDASGRKMHSWRVLILPYLNRNDLYMQYDRSQPWDVNMERIYETPQVFQSDKQSPFGAEANYYLVVGPGTLFPTVTASLGPSDLVDEPSKTILLVEARAPAGSLMHWMEPSDLDIRSMQFAVGASDGIEIGGRHAGGAMVATVDQRTHFLRDTLSSAEIRGLFSPAGSEPLPDDILD